jgi:hypothetical protein
MFFNIEKQAIADKEQLAAFKLTKVEKAKIAAPVDEFDLEYSDIKIIHITDEELKANEGNVLLFDVESYPNFFFIGFKLFGENKFYFWTTDQPTTKLAYLLNRFTIVGFNSRSYDIVMSVLAMMGRTDAELFKASYKIISEGLTAYRSEQEFDIKIPYFNHIDLIEVAPLDGSLKLYAGRLNCKRMQDLPYEYNRILTNEERKPVINYNSNDLSNTELLAIELEQDLVLRVNLGKQYGIDLRSKSDAQIAETIIIKELERIKGEKVSKTIIPEGTRYFYLPPSFVRFSNPSFQNALQTICRAELIVGENGGIELPEEIKGLELKLGNCTYRLGIGGLHSSESSIVHKADENYLLIDRDVASYYPNIMINCGLFPEHLGKEFLEVYGIRIVKRRLEAKKSGDKITADGLKIAANGTFGKLGNKYSVLYSPNLLMQVTITGQLCLLMLIEMIEEAGIEVISANTDGVVSKVNKFLLDKYEAVIKQWETITGFETEETQYSAVYSRDVNNYIAVGTDGKIKTKGTYSEKGSARNSHLSRNPEAFVCNDAVISYLTKNTPIENTIRACKEITKFVTVRNVKGGAVKSDKYLGKTIRWYYSTNCKGEITYKLSGNKVPNSDGAMPLMELPDNLPTDINYDYYINKAKEMLVDLGVIKPTSNQKELFI